MSSIEKPLNQLGAVQAADAIERGDITSVALVRACLERIEERNSLVHAFVTCDAARALASAEQVQANSNAGLLRGVPFAVKDIINTADYPTEYGSPIYQGFQPEADAACVAVAKSRGAILLGKVATGEFATQTPSNARNPLRLEHTPGGSSSGSAAAVADFMVPVAFGTQTTGSIIRPAVYCGVIGYKPSFNLISTAGAKALSPSQDTIGLITRNVEDAAFFSLGLHGAKTVHQSLARPRIAVCMSRQWDYAKPETVHAIERMIQHLEAAGVSVKHIWLPSELEAVIAIQPRLFMYEARQALAHERLNHGDRLSPRLQARLKAGEDIQLDEYISMQLQLNRARFQAQSLFQDNDAVLYPAAAGEAELGLTNAGDPRFGALWTLLHLPSVSFPIDLGPAGLPLGAQLIGGFGQDARLLTVANAITRAIPQCK
ncbi:MAG TPA: amidase [Eoetvoesiella sp.]